MYTVFWDSLKTSGMTVVQLITGVFTSIILARFLGPANFGIYLFILVICSTSVLIFNPCIYAASNYFLSTKKYSVNDLWVTVLVLSIIYGIAASVSAILVYQITNQPSSVSFVVSTVVIFVVVVSGVIFSNFTGMMYGNHEIGLVSMIGTGVSVLRATILIIFVSINSDISWVDAIILHSVVELLNTCFVIIFSVSRLSPKKWNKHLAMDLTRYGLSVYPGRVSNFLSYRIDSYLITGFLGNASYGLYGTATSLAELLWNLPRAIGLVLLPNLGSLSLEHAAKRTLHIAQIVFFATILQAVGLALLLPLIVPKFYGSAYSVAIIPTLILLPGVVMFSVFRVLEPFFQSQQKPWIPSKASLLGLIINVAVNLVFIKLWGIKGAALASTISYASQSLYLMISWSRMVKIPWWKLFKFDLLYSGRLIIKEFIKNKAMNEIR